ncbi:hypothetical protein FGIG_08817 [Fasciola gigantica]|uniref:Uncharacterized protein n=1 Tax=Fasciola gigantica TaxID=46835 RepID=A0A504YYF1_FASGI|nr:hypothetical protein FGIG_08817 [Fasciola gigantica]
MNTNKYKTLKIRESVCGHYTQISLFIYLLIHIFVFLTQVVWQESIYLGCGVTQCPKNKFPYGLSYCVQLRTG